MIQKCPHFGHKGDCGKAGGPCEPALVPTCPLWPPIVATFNERIARAAFAFGAWSTPPSEPPCPAGISRPCSECFTFDRCLVRAYRQREAPRNPQRYTPAGWRAPPDPKISTEPKPPAGAPLPFVDDDIGF